MPVDKVMYSSDRDDWETPPELFATLDNFYNFKIDAAASAKNAKCETYFTKEDNGLLQDWDKTTWCNPPYGREVAMWIQKGCEESEKHNSTVVMLVAARVGTIWFHEYVFNRAREVHFIKGRLNFVGGKYVAPFYSMVVVWQGEMGYIGYTEFYAMSRDGYPI